MAQMKLLVVAAALLAALALASAVPMKYHHDDVHPVSESSSESSESSESSASAERQQQQQNQQSEEKTLSNIQNDEEVMASPPQPWQPIGNAIPFETKENEALPPYPRTLIKSKHAGDQRKMEPGQPWESQYKHGLSPAKLPAQENDYAHGYRHSIIHPYGDDIHA